MRTALLLLALAGSAWGQAGFTFTPKPEYVSTVGGAGWIAGVCGAERPSCPSMAKLEWRSKEQCIYRCVVSAFWYDSTVKELRCSVNGEKDHPCILPKPKPKEVIHDSSAVCPARDERAPDGKMKAVPCFFVKPEPMDIEAIIDRTDKVCIQYSAVQWDGNQCEKYENVKHWTCVNKLRVLLTAEDGSKHCILFPKRAE